MTSGSELTERMNSQDAENAVVAEQEEGGTLFYTLDECYIFSKVGKENGEPIDDSDVLYDTAIDEILALDLKRRDLNYVRCEMPIEGWVFLPKDKENEKYENEAANGASDKKEEKKEDNNDNNNSDGNGPSFEDEAELGGAVDFGDSEERRDYQRQRMMKLPIQPKFRPEDEEAKAWVPIAWLDRWLKKLVFLFRKYPFFPGLIIFVIQAVIESVILFDVVTDVSVTYTLYNLSQKDGRLQIWFMWTCIFIAAPYLIAWSAVSQMAGRKLRENSDSVLWKMLIIVFDIAPIGAFMLFMNDIYHWLEAIVKPVWQLLTWGKPWIRNISFEELGYYKLRRVSEIFAESICQTAVQAYILFSGLYSGGNVVSIITSIISSIFITCLWSLIIFLEGKKNGMSFAEYTTVIFQGSFNFVPMLPAIERGSPNGKKVNWTYYKLNAEAVGHVGKALLSRNCRLNFMKISTYTLSKLHRFGAKYFGSMIQNSPLNVEICVSRLEQDVRALFEEYDSDGDWSFDFWEFTRVSLKLKQAVKERLIRKDVNDVFIDLADSIEHKVWLLDLIIKIRGSVERMPLLDFDSALDYALDEYDFKLMSFLMAFKYDELNDVTKQEFQKCCARAITYNPDNDPSCADLPNADKKLKMETSIAAAMCLCEDKGVPIVVRVIRGQDLIAMDDDGKSDPYIRVDCLGIEESTSIRKQTLNPIWEEDLLFILPFDTVSQLLAAAKAEKNGNNDALPATMAGDMANNDASAQFGVRQASGNASEQIKKAQQIPNLSTLPKYVSKYRIDASTFNMSSADLFDEKEKSGTAVGAVNENEEVARVSPSDLDNGDSPSTMNVFGRLSRTKSKLTGQDGSNASKLVVKFRIHDYDVNDEDDYMGSHKIRIDLSENTSDFHEELQRIQVSHWQRKPGTSGYLEFRVYLNVLQYYQDHGLSFIDQINESSKFRAREDKQFEEMAKGNDKDKQLTFQV